MNDFINEQELEKLSENELFSKYAEMFNAHAKVQYLLEQSMKLENALQKIVGLLSRKI